MQSCAALIGLMLCGAGGTAEKGVEPLILNIQDSRFTINGQPTFLLGISYYGALGAPEAFIQADLQDMRRYGFNWLRVWATWAYGGNDVSAVDMAGQPRAPYLQRLQKFVAECQRQGLIVDVTLTRGKRPGGIADLSAHKRAVKIILEALREYRNWYLDLANERNIRDDRFVSIEELKELREFARTIDAQRLVTASWGGDMNEAAVRDAIEKAGLDFICPHRPRNAASPAETERMTKQLLRYMEAIGRRVPVHYQEPFRRGYREWEPQAEDFLTDLRGAIAGGAAGWCFHNGATRRSPDGQPGRSFNMRTRRLFEQLDEQERYVVAHIREAVPVQP